MVALKFHVNPKTGEKGKCEASIKACPHGEAFHSDTMLGVQIIYENYMIDTLFSRHKRFGEPTIQQELEKKIANFIASKQDLELEHAIHVQHTQKLIADKASSLPEEAVERRMQHIENLTAALIKENFDTESQFSEVVNDTRIYTQERADLHERIVDHFMREFEGKGLPKGISQPKALFAGGVGGAGKGSILADLGVKKYFAIVNPDDIKEYLASEGHIPSIPGLSPMEVSTLVHEEASHVSKILAERLKEEKYNICYDITMGGLASTEAKILNLKKAKYKTGAVFVDITIEESEKRAAGRYKGGMDEFFASGGQSIGGRPVPKGVNNPSVRGHNSQNADNLERIIEKRLLDGEPRVYSNMVAFGEKAKRIPIAEFFRKDD